MVRIARGFPIPPLISEPMPARADITGTATASIDEDDITAGGKTIIITLVGDQWLGAGDFNAIRQDIINGLDSAQSEGTGWNAEVRDKEVVTAVVRTDGQIVTITLTAQAAYDITSQETITVTVPSTALLRGVLDVTGSPTFTVAAVGAVVVGDGLTKGQKLNRLQLVG